MLDGELTVHRAGSTLRLHGDLDLVTVEELRVFLDDAVLTEPANLVVDLSDVAFVDLLSLSTILASADSLRDRGARLVVSGASAAVRRVCALLNADDVLAPLVPMPRLS